MPCGLSRWRLWLGPHIWLPLEIAAVSAAVIGLLGLCRLCTLAFSVVGVGVLDRLLIKTPLTGAVPQVHWPLWVLFQFGLVALPEGLFFRGLLPDQLPEIPAGYGEKGSLATECVGVCLSAGLFAVAHVLILGGAASLLTFFSGLIFAWLSLRSGALLPPVLLHGAAHTGYLLEFGAAM